MLYDPATILSHIRSTSIDFGSPSVLSLELAILEGKLGNHRRALEILTRDLSDATAAEAYCAQGGDVVPIKTAGSIGEAYGLQMWTNVGGKGGAGGGKAGKGKVVDEGVKKELLKVLLEVYMSVG